MRQFFVQLVVFSVACAFLLPLAGAIEPVKVGVFDQEVALSYSAESDALPSDDVLAIAVDRSGGVWAGTARGLARFDGAQKWSSVHRPSGWTHVEALGAQAVPVVVAAPDGAVYAATAQTLYRCGPDQAVVHCDSLPAYPTALAQGAGALWLGTREGLYRIDGGKATGAAGLTALLGDDQRVAGVAVSRDGRVAVAAAAGLFLSHDGEAWERLLPRDGARSWAPVDVRAVVFDAEDALWFASLQGAGRYSAGWTLFTGAEGLPYNEFSSAAAGADGALWFGTAIGAIRFNDGAWAYREGRRWLPGNDVRGIALDARGQPWFATGAGVGLIELRPMTLAEKARFFQDEIDKRHRRTEFGYVQSVVLDKPGDKSAWRNRDDDNDGQYTGMYGAAQCFAYAATKDPKAKERAKQAFEALAFLSEVTQGGERPAPKGFPARTILPTSDPRNPNEEHSYSVARDEARRESDRLWKVIHPRWPVSEDGKWYWKCDTSSDELDGHYYLYARYYDLAAETEEEKAHVRQVVRDMTDHLILHDFKLVDWDGEPTRWANFDPDSLNLDPDWWAERGLNSMSILAHLRAAEHITGDPKYGRIADALAARHTFAMNVMYPKNQRGPGSYVQFDDEMAFLNYYNLLAYEKNPTWRQMFANSCFMYWELEECEQNAFFNFTYAAACGGVQFESPWGTADLSPQQKCIDDAVETLKRYPLDRFNWRHTNSHRLDIVPLPAYRREPGEAEGRGSRVDGVVLPVDERYMHLWADDPWTLDTGGQGNVLADGAAYLLAYYMGLYHGYIIEE